MSKTSVGDVYAKVISDVCEASRQDFEEGGVELATLDLLKSEWQKKLSALKVAQLPWDPTPAPTIKEQPAGPSNVKSAPQTVPSNGARINTPPASQPPPAPSAPMIKAENDTKPSYPAQQAPSIAQTSSQQYQVPSFQQGQPMTARDRAAMNLHQTYGQRAGVQIAQLQSSSQSRVPMPSAAPTSSYIKQEDSTGAFDGVQDFSGDLKLPVQPLNPSQTDGAGDARDEWDSEYAQRKEFTAAHGAAGDQLVRTHIQNRQQELEAGGLLMTLDEHVVPNRSASRKVHALTTSDDQLRGEGSSSIRRAQGDATGDDDDEDDADAINSDLDDPDDDAAADENGEGIYQVMLCTYDKVQRVKNKWKCTLKDGVLRVDGNEYVFHKGQGEFEW